MTESLKLHDQLRFEFHYIYFLPWKDQMVNEITGGGGVVTCLPSANNFQIMLKYRAIIRYIRQQEIKLVHCHLPWAGMVGRIVHRFTGVTVIYTEHNKQERYHFATRLMNKLTFNWQSRAIAVSRDVAESIKKNIPVRIPVHEIQNGVNTNYFRRHVEAGRIIKQQLNIPDGSLVVGIVAVFRFQKRLKEWLEIFAAVSIKYPNLFGIIVGDGPLKQEIIQQVETLGLKEKIMMPGLQTDVKPWLSAMDVFMMTSVFEGLPVALLEAMSMECTILTTDAGGIKEVIRPNQDGILVAVDQWKDLTIHLELLLHDHEKRISLAQTARRRVETHFGIEKMVKELEELYEGCRLPVTGNSQQATGNNS